MIIIIILVTLLCFKVFMTDMIVTMPCIFITINSMQKINSVKQNINNVRSFKGKQHEFRIERE